MHRYLPIASLLALTALMGAPSVARTEERIPNGGFEEPGKDGQGAAHWGTGNLPGVAFRIDTESPHSGERCALVESTDVEAMNTNVSGWRQNIEIDSTQPLFFSCWMKLDGVGNGRIGCLHQPKEGKNLDNQSILRFRGTREWHRVTGVIEPKPGTINLQLYMGLIRSPGRVWFDDVSLIPTVLLPDGTSIHEKRAETAAPFEIVLEPRPLAGEPSRVVIRRLREDGTTMKDFVGEVALGADAGVEGLPARLAFAKSDQGEKTLRVRFPSPDAQRVSLEWEGETIVSNPALPRTPDEAPLVFTDRFDPEPIEEMDLPPVLAAAYSVPFRLAFFGEAPGRPLVPEAETPAGLDLEGFRRSLYGRRAYATTGRRGLMFFRVNGAEMGGRVEAAAPAAPRAIAWRVIGTDRVQRVEIMRNGQPVRTYEVNRFDVGDEWTCRAEAKGAEYWSLRATQKDGGVLWCSPVSVLPAR